MLAGTAAPPNLCQHSRIQPLLTAIAPARQHGVHGVNGARAQRSSVRCAAAVAAATIAAAANIIDQPADNGLSMHPDAVKRRQEAEARLLPTLCSACQSLRNVCGSASLSCFTGERQERPILHMLKRMSGASVGHVSC